MYEVYQGDHILCYFETWAEAYRYGVSHDADFIVDDMTGEILWSF